MKPRILLGCLVLSALLLIQSNGVAQKMSVDGKFGLSIFSGGDNNSRGLLLGGALDLPIGQNLYARPEVNITTHSSTPIELGGGVKYNIPSTGSTTQFYVDGGLGLWFFSGGPYLGLDFTGGAIFPLNGENFKIPAEVRIGPIFISGNTVFQIALTSGIRFSIQ